MKAIDLTKGHGRLSRQSLGTEEPDAPAREEAVWIDIDNAFSRPVASSDGEENYIPTRILAELFQEAGYDAIVYQSQFGQENNGYNIAVFQLEDGNIFSCAPYKVESIQVKAKQEREPWYLSGGLTL